MQWTLCSVVENYWKNIFLDYILVFISILCRSNMWTCRVLIFISLTELTWPFKLLFKIDISTATFFVSLFYHCYLSFIIVISLLSLLSLFYHCYLSFSILSVNWCSVTLNRSIFINNLCIFIWCTMFIPHFRPFSRVQGDFTLSQWGLCGKAGITWKMVSNCFSLDHFKVWFRGGFLWP